MEFFDTHCHIHFSDYGLDREEVFKDALGTGVKGMLVVGCTLQDSKLGIEFAKSHQGAWATIGLHPHEGLVYANSPEKLQEFEELVKNKEVVGIGECGLDFYYNHSPKKEQIKILEFQLDLAVKNSLPVVLHIREAFEDFWPVFDNFSGLSGVVHSFTAHTKELDQILERELFIGLNGIVTFAKDEEQLQAAKRVPLQKLLLETDAPFLTPTPFRGKVCEPKHVVSTAEFLANLREESLAELAKTTTSNARQLFRL